MTRQQMELAGIWKLYGPREKRVLLHIARRLLRGQELFGKLTHRKKKWLKEATEETLDLSVYLACKLTDMEDEDT